MERGNVLRQKSSRRSRTQEEDVEYIRRNMCTDSIEIYKLHTTQNVLYKRLKLRDYKTRLRHEVKDTSPSMSVEDVNFILNEI
jgi:hypothetical protein